MADLVVKVGDAALRPGRVWQDGDLISAISTHRRRARLARVAWRADCLTGPPVMVRHAQGEYQGGGLHEEIHKTFHRVSVRVVSATEIETTYPGVAPWVTGSTPMTHPVTGRPTWIHLPEYLAHLRQHGTRLFRDPVTDEIRWYAKELPLPPTLALDALWQKLKFGHGWQAGGHRELDLWPFGVRERAAHLVLYVDDWLIEQEQTWIDSPLEPKIRDVQTLDHERLVRRRGVQIQWRTLSGMSASHQAKVLDPIEMFDRRLDHAPYPVSVIEVKG